jgi:glycosyltransferase involved in cell wall biosynthesis
MPADLGILIVTLKRRRPFLDRLMRRLAPQLSPRVEVFTLEDEGAETIGAKRQRMIEACDSRYLCFVDDDDLVHTDYCELILKALDEDPDVVGFRTNYYEDGKLHGHGVISVLAKKWHSTPAPRRGDKPTHWRTPNHLSPVRREMALSIGFPSLMHGEDADYSIRMFKKYPTMREKFIGTITDDGYNRLVCEGPAMYEYFYRTPKRRVEREDMVLA